MVGYLEVKGNQMRILLAAYPQVIYCLMQPLVGGFLEEVIPISKLVDSSMS